MNEQKQKKHTLLYLLIIILLAGLMFLAGLTCVSMYKMSAIQKDFVELLEEIDKMKLVEENNCSSVYKVPLLKPPINRELLSSSAKTILNVFISINGRYFARISKSFTE